MTVARQFCRNKNITQTTSTMALPMTLVREELYHADEAAHEAGQGLLTGIGLCLCLVYAYFTAGVLRRPNASIYMSVLLAVVYYLTQMRSEQPDALPDGEEKRA